MERKIGERFEYQGVALEVCPELDGCEGMECCKDCYFFENGFDCPENELKDLLCTIDAIHPVIFKEVKK